MHLLPLLFSLLACAPQRIQFSSPGDTELILVRSRQVIEIPSQHELRPGRYPVELKIEAERAKALGLKGPLSLYGWLEVGQRTVNSSLTAVVLDVPDDLVRAASQDGRVLQSLVLDEQAQVVLVSLKLGAYNPAQR